MVNEFPRTRHSVLIAIRGADARARELALETLAAAYWRPIYKYLRIRRRSSREDAEDLVQAFFARALEKNFFDGYDPGRARFRTFLRTCVDGFAANQHKSAARLKRGGGTRLLPLDYESAEGELRHHDAAIDVDPETWFHHEWVRNLFALSVDALRRQCETQGKSLQFRIFERYDLEGEDTLERPTYAQLAAEHDIPVTQVTNHLASARRRFRELVLEQLRETTGSDAEFRAEALDLLGVDPQ